MNTENRSALIGAIQKFSTEDGPGIRTTVFLKGCPLNCLWCHNPEMIDPRQELIQMPNSCIGCGYCIQICPQKAISAGEDGKIQIDRDLCDRCFKCADDCYAEALKRVATEMTAQEAFAQVLQDKDFYDHTEGGMTLSGGEILSQPDFVREMVALAEANGVGVCLDTSGFGDGSFLMEMAGKEIVSDILYDIKAMDPDKHVQLTGQRNELILSNLRALAADPVICEKIQIRMPLIAGMNDNDADMEAVVALLSELQIKKVTLLPYHEFGISKKRNIGGKQERFQTPTDERLDAIRNLFTASDINVNILGRL